jgi:cbb3-type cytochrome oxidase subunit 3
MLTISSLYLIWLFPRENQTVIVISRFVLFIICIYINFRTIKKKFFIEENDSLLDEAFTHDNIKTQIMNCWMLYF